MIPLLEKNKKDLIYFDNASTTQKPQEVIDVIKYYYEKANANPSRGLYDLAQYAKYVYDGARYSVADFIGGLHDNVVFTKNATESINMVAYGWGLEHIKKDDKILIFIEEHHSNILPWEYVASKTGAKIEFGYSLEDMVNRIDERTKVVAVTLQSNVLGEPHDDISGIIEKAHEYNAIVVADATQYIVHNHLNVIYLGADFVAFSGHKLYAPMGIGVLYGKRERLQEMNPFIYGGGMVDKVNYDSVVYKDYPDKFEAGTVNVEGAIGLSMAIDVINKTPKTEQLLTYELIKGLKEMPFITVVGKNQRGIVSFDVKDIHPHDVAEYMNKNNICIRAGKMCAEPLLDYLGYKALCRVSFGYYNTVDEVYRFLDVLSNIRKEFYV